ncbi:MAG: archaeosortase/exosortase family protein [Alphaproteobacteria bacterium]|nr:archaeosortase/exosortase family protein [Alphaproteobacteria bacterium]
MVANALLLLAWAALHAEPARWLGRGLLATEGPLHLAVAAVLVGLLARSVRLGDVRDALTRPAGGPWTAWLLAVGLPVLARPLPGPRSLLGALMVVSAYGLLGLFVAPETWRRGRAVALLAAGVLPLSQHLDVILGLPLRAATAAAVSGLFGSLSSATVLEVEGGYAHVDLPCSGVQSLWSATVVLAAATLAWRRTPDLRWLGALLGTFVLLVLANGVRIAVLVGAHHRLGLPVLAEVLHTPLGVVGFVLALAPALGWLASSAEPAAVTTRRPGSFGPVALAAVALALAVGVPRLERQVRAGPVPTLPAGFAELEPSAQEREFVEGRGGALRKASFAVGGLTGTVARVSSHDWVTQHVPELCHASGGWELVADHPALVGDTPVRWARMERAGEVATALWWFESPDHVTADHTERIARGLVSDTPWVLTSLLVPGAPSPADPDLLAVVASLRADPVAKLESP